MIRLIATDLDGTLIPPGRPVPAAVMEALREALDRQIPVVPASGRSLAAIPGEILSLPGLRYVISSNGAVVQDLRRDMPLRQILMAAPEAAEVLRMLWEKGIYSCAYSGNQIYNWKWTPAYLERYYPTRASLFQRNPQENLTDFLEARGLGVEKLFVAVPDGAMREAVRREIGRWPQLQVTSSSSRNLEINRRGADKGSALAWLAGTLGVSREEVAALGDNENDATMLAYAGWSGVPENAIPQVKPLARQVFPPCEEGGAAVFLSKILLDR